MSTKIHATCDALGNPTSFHLTPGHHHDLKGADVLLPKIEAHYLLADRAHQAQKRVREVMALQGTQVVIPSEVNARKKKDYDSDLYKRRHLIENLWLKLKNFRAIATRYDKTQQKFLGAIYLAAITIWLN